MSIRQALGVADESAPVGDAVKSLLVRGTCSDASPKTGGTSEAVYNAKTDIVGTNQCLLYSTPTCTTARATKNLYSTPLIGPDVSPAEGVFKEVVWTPEIAGHPLAIVGPGALAVFTWAGTTGPTWAWTFAWAEVPTRLFNG